MNNRRNHDAKKKAIEKAVHNFKTVKHKKINK